MSFISKIMAKPFRMADEYNRQIIIGWLERLSSSANHFVEVGPGGRPLLEEVAGDISRTIIELPEIIEYCEGLNWQCLGQNARTDRWGLDDGSVDVVVSQQCLEHIPQTDHFISEAHRVLRPGGNFIVSVPNQGALVFILFLLLTFNPPMNYVSDRWYGLGNPLSNIRYKPREVPGHAHLRLFVMRAMADLLKMHGYEVVKMHGGSWGLPLAGRLLARIFPYYGLYTTIWASKKEDAISV